MTQHTLTAELPQGSIDYTERGDGPVVLAVHGYLMGGDLWSAVADRLAARGFRVITPTWPMGAHRTAMAPGTDCTPAGQAEIVAAFMDSLGLSDVTLLGNDSGGAVCQLVVTGHGERVGRLVLTNCDAFDKFPPMLFKPLVMAARSKLLLGGVASSMRVGMLRRSPMAYGLLSHTGVDELARGWVTSLADPHVFDDTRELTLGMRPAVTEAVAERLESVDMPTLIAWGADDRLFPLSLGRRLAAALENSTMVEVPRSRTLVMIDQPERLAELIADFAAASLATGSSGAGG